MRLPFREASFDCVVNTMAFSGYPRAVPVVAEFRRVLRPSGRLLLLDVAYPRDENTLGMALIGLWRLTGDVIRDVGPLLEDGGFRVEEHEVGGFGSVHLYRAIAM
jgi:ubiquinone/menaquinone biosynthesis C-methylase UbiE